MSRSKLLLDLVRAGARGDRTLFLRSLEAVVEDERAKQHHVLAECLAAYLQPGARAAMTSDAQPSRRMLRALEIDPATLEVGRTEKSIAIELVDQYPEDVELWVAVERHHQVVESLPCGRIRYEFEDGSAILRERVRKCAPVP